MTNRAVKSITRASKRGRKSRQELSLDTGEVTIPVGAIAQITSDPVKRAFVPEYLHVECPGLWSISHFQVDGQTIAKGHFSGWRFECGSKTCTPLSKIGVPPLRRGQQIGLIVHYHGHAKFGRAFRGAIIGR
jgi:hypothetical protein